MALNDDLQIFVRDALGRGTPRPVLADVLGRAGWQKAQIDATLGSFADVEFPVPVPRPRPLLSARDAFVYLVLFSTLYSAVTHTGTIAFLLIDRLFPDPAAPALGWRAEYFATAMRWALAAVIVSLPVFLFTGTRVAREVEADPTKRQSSVRRWLTYITLFFGATVLICDVMALIYYALGGELTIRFIAKVVTVGGLAGCVVGYCQDLRGDEAPRA